jgi:Zn-dependent membrane protease YugP
MYSLDKYQIIAVLAIIVLILLIVVLTSRTRIVRTYNKYLRIDNKLNITGSQFAFVAKEQLGLGDLRFSLTKNKLGDCYNYKHKTLVMSEEVCKTASLASMTIVAHELGHAMQHKENSPLFSVTILTNKLTRLTSPLIIPLLIIGLFFYVFQYPSDSFGYILMVIAGCLFILQFINKLIHIPLEYNASRRALKFLKENNYLTHGEYLKAKKLLGIAAQTYIAGFFDEIIPIKLKRKKRK